MQCYVSSLHFSNQPTRTPIPLKTTHPQCVLQIKYFLNWHSNHIVHDESWFQVPPLAWIISQTQPIFVFPGSCSHDHPLCNGFPQCGPGPRKGWATVSVFMVYGCCFWVWIRSGVSMPIFLLRKRDTARALLSYPASLYLQNIPYHILPIVLLPYSNLEAHPSISHLYPALTESLPSTDAFLSNMHRLWPTSWSTLSVYISSDTRACCVFLSDTLTACSTTIHDSTYVHIDRRGFPCLRRF